MNHQYSIHCARTSEAFSALSDAWSNLYVESPFMTFQWLHSWWEKMISKDDLYIVTVRNPAGETELIAPFYLHHSRTRGKEIRFLGSGRICSDYASFPFRCSENAQGATSALGQWLIEQRDWDCINLEGAATADPLVSCFLESLYDAGHQIVEREEESFWRLELSESFDEFLATRSKKIRQKIRKIERELVPATTIEFCKTPQDVSESLDHFAAMHIARHEAVHGHKGCFENPSFRDFLNETLVHFLDQERLWFGTTRFDGEVASSCIAIESNQVLYYYQTSFDPAKSRLQPGWLQNTMLIKRAIESGIRSIDFLRGNEDYKSKIGAIPIPHIRYRTVANRSSSIVRFQLWNTLSTLKHSLPFSLH
ncbi:MAG: GNAT family N-acetyltransferase [Pirellulaceae bacterium]